MHVLHKHPVTGMGSYGEAFATIPQSCLGAGMSGKFLWKLVQKSHSGKWSDAGGKSFSLRPWLLGEAPLYLKAASNSKAVTGDAFGEGAFSFL